MIYDDLRTRGLYCLTIRISSQCIRTGDRIPPLAGMSHADCGLTDRNCPYPPLISNGQSYKFCRSSTVYSDIARQAWLVIGSHCGRVSREYTHRMKDSLSSGYCSALGCDGAATKATALCDAVSHVLFGNGSRQQCFSQSRLWLSKA